MESLNVGGWLAVYAPYIDQAETSYRVAKKLGFYDIEIIAIDDEITHKQVSDSW